MKDNKNYIPDPRSHRCVSVIKSAVRMCGYACLLINIPIACVILIISELIGVIEEYV